MLLDLGTLRDMMAKSLRESHDAFRTRSMWRLAFLPSLFSLQYHMSVL
jgi:hypothetical protein